MLTHPCEINPYVKCGKYILLKYVLSDTVIGSKAIDDALCKRSRAGPVAIESSAGAEGEVTRNWRLAKEAALLAQPDCHFPKGHLEFLCGDFQLVWRASPTQTTVQFSC
jgi:hypothetical protein